MRFRRRRRRYETVSVDFPKPAIRNLETEAHIAKRKGKTLAQIHYEKVMAGRGGQICEEDM